MSRFLNDIGDEPSYTGKGKMRYSSKKSQAKTRRTTTTQTIEVRHVHDPATGELLGVLSAAEIPKDSTKLVAFARKKLQASAPRKAVTVLTGHADGWDKLRSCEFWSNVRDHGFWEVLGGEFDKMPYGMGADATGIHERFGRVSVNPDDPQVVRDVFTKLIWRAVCKLREAGLQNSGDPEAVWIDLLSSNNNLARTTVSSGFDQEGLPLTTKTPYIECIHTASVKLCSALSTQALKNDLIAIAESSQSAQQLPKEGLRPDQGKRDAGKVRAETVAKVIEELNILKPQMFEDEAEYNELRNRYSDFLTVAIAGKRPDLKQKILCIRGSVRHIRLAQEIAAAHYGLSRETIADAWKRYKPAQYKLLARSRVGTLRRKPGS